MTTRRQVREALGVAFANQGFNTVYTYPPLGFPPGATKVLVISNAATSFTRFGAGFQDDFYTFNLDVYILRTDSVNTEDLLDDLAEVIRAVIKANIVNSAWDEITREDDSQAIFAEVTGVPYRLERHPLKIKMSGT